VNENLNAIISGAFLKLRPKIKIESEYLALVLNSIVCQKQIEQFSGGAIIAHLKPSDAMNLQIPLLPLQTQQQISQKVIESKENHKTSKFLLETAKKAVEMAIEENEKVAMGFIDERV
jgi:type I restriction enzyme S subunit